MKLPSLLLALLLTNSFLAPFARAYETNLYPKSQLEVFEERTGTILVRGTDDIGTVAGKTSGITVRCRETRDLTTGERVYGVQVIVGQPGGAADTTVVDYDELDALIRSTDYVTKAEWSVASSSHFEVGYTTRSGLKVAGYSSRRGASIEAYVLSNRLLRSRCDLAMYQLIQLHDLLELARTKIDTLQKSK